MSYPNGYLDEHLITSKIVEQTFRVSVWRPQQSGAHAPRLLPLYVGDSHLFFAGAVAIVNVLQLLRETPPYLVIGIGYEDISASELLRWRDFVPQTTRMFYQGTLERLAETEAPHVRGESWGLMHKSDAQHFLRFIREELVPFVDARYDVYSNQATYYGYSAGAMFGLYTLFSQPGTFRHYLLGSPPTVSGEHCFAIDAVRAFRESNRAINATLYLSVGEWEEFEATHYQFEFVSGFYRFLRYLKQNPMEGLQVSAEVFPRETHSTAWALCLMHGLKELNAGNAAPKW